MTDAPGSNRILVGVDGSASSIEALREAATLASALDAPLEVVTTWIYPMATEYYAAEGWSPEEDAAEILRTTIADTFGDAPPQGLVATVLRGPAARTLIEQSEHARMLVLGSRGHGGFVGMLLGSVSAACAEHASCPVLIVHGPHPQES